MKLQTYRARSMADALTEVKKDLGARAVILHTRTVKTGGILGFGARQMVEIIASDDDRIASEARSRSSAKGSGRSRGAPAKTPDAPPQPPQPRRPDARALQAYATAGTLSTPVGAAHAAPPAGDPRLAASASGEAMPEAEPQVMNVKGRAVGSMATPVSLRPVDAAASNELSRELDAIKHMVGQVLRTSGASPATGSLPEPLFQQYLRLIEAEVAKEIADDIIASVRDELTAGELTDETIVRQTLLRHLAGRLPVVDVAPLAEDGRSGPRVIALVGATGVGKTTTVAKLAAAYKLRHGKRVGLITSDTYRIAAVEQLRTYANIIGLKLEVVLTPAEMKAAVASLASCDVVLIDTAGRSQYNGEQLDELAEILDAASPDETHLVLSSIANESVMKKTIERFSVVGPNRVIFTKLDEAVNFGVLVNVTRSLSASLSFVTTGQEVPDHIEPSQSDRLARLVLDGLPGGCAAAITEAAHV